MHSQHPLAIAAPLLNVYSMFVMQQLAVVAASSTANGELPLLEDLLTLSLLEFSVVCVIADV